MRPDQDLNPQRRHMPLLGIEPVTFSLCGTMPHPLSHSSQGTPDLPFSSCVTLDKLADFHTVVYLHVGWGQGLPPRVPRASPTASGIQQVLAPFLHFFCVWEKNDHLIEQVRRVVGEKITIHRS